MPIEPDALVRRAPLARHGIAVAVLFGSRARGDARAGSDVDVAVLAADGHRLSLREIGALKHDLESGGALRFDVIDLTSADTLVRFEILREGRVLIGGDEPAWKALIARTLIEHDRIAPYVQACVRGVGRNAAAGGAR